MGFRYIGAKTRIVREIVDAIDDLARPRGRVADLMCGTAAVSAELRRRQYCVVANDVLTFCYHHARVALLLTDEPQFSGCAELMGKDVAPARPGLFPPTRYHAIMQAMQMLPPAEGYFWRELSPGGMPANGERPRQYFSTVNAKRIDAARALIRQLHVQGKITDLEHSLLIHDLIMAANDIANIAGTYGHYLSHFIPRAETPLEFHPTPIPVYADAGRHSVLCGYAEQVAADLNCDVCYLDPPYMKRQYAANYHVLETIAREDEPEAIGVSGLRPWRDGYSDFCTRTRIQRAFDAIITKMECRNFLVSYSEDGLLSLPELEAILKKHGSVRIRTLRNKRFKSNNSKLAPDITEYLAWLAIR